MSTVEGDARRALSRLRRAVEKAAREVDALEGSIRAAEGEDFPEATYEDAREHLRALLEMVEGESQRLQDKMLHAGGLEPGRIRRSSARG